MNTGSSFRIAILAALLVFCVFQLPQVRGWEAEAADLFDKRTAVKVLFIGNSRTFFNHMPFMVRTVADSAHSPQKYEITMHAPGGIRLEDQWNSSEVQELLKQKWDYVVLQGRSNEQLDAKVNESFQTYGRKLAELAKSAGSVPVLYVIWRYSDDDEHYKQDPELRSRHQDMIQASYAELASATGGADGERGQSLGGIAPRRAADAALLRYQSSEHPRQLPLRAYVLSLLFP